MRKVPIPSSMSRDPIKTIPTDSCCFTVHYQPDGCLLVGTDTCLLKFDGDFTKTTINSSNTVSTYIDKASMIYVVTEKGRQGYVRGGIVGSKSFQKQVEYAVEPNNTAVVTGDESLVVYTDHTNSAVVLHDKNTKQKANHRLTGDHPPTYVCFHHGGLLVTDKTKGLLSKYTISKAHGIEQPPKWEWECNLPEPDSICVDAAGLIYVNSNRQKTVYVISEGK